MSLKDALGHGNKEMSVMIRKEKAIHEQLWFQILTVLAGAGIIALAVMLYIRRKTRIYEKKAEENKIYIREMTESFAKVIDLKDRYLKGRLPAFFRFPKNNKTTKRDLLMVELKRILIRRFYYERFF